MKHVLVTGASGFIGWRLCQRLVDDGCIVRALLRTPQEGPWQESVLGDLEHLPDDLMQGIDTVFHLAGKVHALQPTWQDDEEQFRINAGGTRRLVALADSAQVKRLGYFSSLSIFGMPPKGQSYDENGALDYQNIYGLSKYYTECNYIFSGNDIPHVTVLRPAMVYGPSCKGNMNRMIEAILKGRFPSIPQGYGFRSMVHVDDVVEAALLVASRDEAAGEAFNLTDGSAYSSRQLYDWISYQLGKTPSRWTMPVWLFRLMAFVGDAIGIVFGKRFIFDSSTFQKLFANARYSSGKIEKVLGFHPKHRLQESLPDIVKEYLNHRP